MSRRRANGEGTLTRRKDGVWTGAVSLGYDANGKRKRRYVYAKTQRECRRKLDEVRRQHAQGVAVDETQTVAAFLERWLHEKATQVQPRTVEIYAGLVKKHIVPYIGRRKLASLKPLHIQQMVTAINTTPGAATANKARRALHGALKQAVRWQLIARNPVEAVDPVKEAEKELRLWTFEETATFLDAARGHRLYAAFYLALGTGLRRGELLGLFWTDLKGDQLHIRRSLTKGDKSGVVWTQPKTRAGSRIVTVPQDALDVLEEHRKRQEAERAQLGDMWERTDLVFASGFGDVITPVSFQHQWTKLQKAAGVPHMRLHDLRHLHVSLLVRRGLDPRTIADRIGHTDASFTLRRYSHMFAEHRSAGAVNIRELLAPDGPVN